MIRRKILPGNCYLILVFFSLLVIACSSDNDQTISDDDPDQTEEPEIKPEDRLVQFEVNTNGLTIVDEPKIAATMRISKEDVISYDGNIGIEIRGASSQMFPKKSYGFETWDENNEDLDIALLDYPEEEDWILYAPYSDKSLFRNMLIYDLSRAIGRYATRTKFVELSINDEFKGVYVFMEKLKRDGERIDINKLKEDEISGEDLTGGYILKIDKTAGSNLGEGYNDQNSFVSQYAPNGANMGQKTYFLYEEPDAEDITSEQKDYISNYVTSFEDALVSDEFTDPDLGYAAYIDVDSFIDFFILNELSNNVDAYRLSTFMYKDKNEKLNMGPIWDFNLAFGNADYCGGGETNVWAYKFNERCPNDIWLVPFWWKRFMEDPNFVQSLKSRWQTLRGSALSNASIMAKIDDYDALLSKAGAIDTNFTTWDILGNYVWPNNFVGSSHEQEIGYLKEWIDDRLSWLDQEIEAL